MCACIDVPVTATAGGTLAMFHATVAIPVVIVGGAADCAAAGATPLARWQAGALLKHTHFVSGLAICFARAVNDTPKLAALLAAAHLGGVDNGPEATFGAIALGMATGGWLSARKVAETMATKITPLSEAQGATANLVTACLVIAASKFGLPVSTTHVSVGAISGAGAANGSIETAALTKILWSWAATLPLGGALAMAAGLIVF